MTTKASSASINASGVFVFVGALVLLLGTTMMGDAFTPLSSRSTKSSALASPSSPSPPMAFLSSSSTTQLSAKYNSMDEILALFPEDKPVLVNFYDGGTEAAIKADIFRAKQLLADRATLVSIKRQDYPALAKLWDADTKSPAMILFRDGQPVTRLYEETHYLEIVARIGQFCTNN